MSGVSPTGRKSVRAKPRAPKGGEGGNAAKKSSSPGPSRAKRREAPRGAKKKSSDAHATPIALHSGLVSPSLFPAAGGGEAAHRAIHDAGDAVSSAVKGLIRSAAPVQGDDGEVDGDGSERSMGGTDAEKLYHAYVAADNIPQSVQRLVERKKNESPESYQKLITGIVSAKVNGPKIRKQRALDEALSSGMVDVHETEALSSKPPEKVAMYLEAKRLAQQGKLSVETMKLLLHPSKQSESRLGLIIEALRTDQMTEADANRLLQMPERQFNKWLYEEYFAHTMKWYGPGRLHGRWH
jgi:hypothetical protein